MFAARFGRGDGRWMTTAGGMVRSEMFPLVNRDQANPIDLSQPINTAG